MKLTFAEFDEIIVIENRNSDFVYTIILITGDLQKMIKNNLKAAETKIRIKNYSL